MIYIKRHKEYLLMKESCKIVAEVLFTLENSIKEGVNSLHLNNIAEKIIYKYNAIPAFKGYRGFPFSICASVNEEAVHGFPNEDILTWSDIISIDVGVIKNNYCGDAAFTKAVGKVRESTQELVNTTEKCLYNAIEGYKNNCKVGDISNIIHETAFVNGFNVIKKYGGHGIGKKVHEKPYVPNYGSGNKGSVLKPGTCIAIEPILTFGKSGIILKENGWTVLAKDLSLTAHFEHTVFLTENGPDILTLY